MTTNARVTGSVVYHRRNHNLKVDTGTCCSASHILYWLLAASETLLEWSEYILVYFTVRLHVTQSTVLRRLLSPSVCLSVCQTRALWQHEINLCLHSYTTWKIVHPSFLTRRMVGGGRPLLPAILGINPGPQAWVQNERRRGEGRDRAFTLSLHAPIDSLQELSLVYSHFVDVQFRHELCVFIDEPSLPKNVRSRMSQLHAAHYTQFSK